MPYLPPIYPAAASDRFIGECEAVVSNSHPILRGCYLQRLPAFDRLNEHATRYLGRRVAFTDVDGVLEVNGRMLVLEHKGQGVALKPGQGPALRELTAASSRITVIANRAAGDGYTENLVMAGGDVITPGWQPWSHAQFWAWFDEWLTIAKMSSPQRPKVGA
jgi:hypothetical protein